MKIGGLILMADEEVGKSWYTKYRPKTMDEYCGDAIKKIVSKRFAKRENMPHVIMIQGSRGCGKTTFARIISKYYLCQNPKEDGTPCEECEACESINDILISGESTDYECPGVTELDATIMNGKEAIQNVLDDAVIEPLYTEYKVLIVDECHMISAAGQNSMLKIIEDIPKHLVVIFATTDPQKVLQTIKSRCQLTLEARKQSVEDMAKRLMQISELEGLTVSQEALEVIARKGNRVPRECINILEGAAKTYDGQVTVDNLKDMFGGANADNYLDYFTAANKSLSATLEYIRALRDKNIKINNFVTGLMQFVMDSMYIKHGIALEDYTTDYIKTIKQLFDMYTSSDFDMLMQIIENMMTQVSDDDDAKNEMLLTLTAMRISKVNLLANGLANEQEEAIVENRVSLVEHQKLLKNDNAEAMEAQKLDLDLAEIKEEFGDVHQVVDTYNLLDEAKASISDMPALDASTEQKAENISIGKELDDFLDN